MAIGSVHQAGATTLPPLQLRPSAPIVDSVHQAEALDGLGSNLRKGSKGGRVYKTLHGVFTVSCYALSLCAPDKINHDQLKTSISIKLTST
jgi:hypothetical protein